MNCRYASSLWAKHIGFGDVPTDIEWEVQGRTAEMLSLPKVFGCPSPRVASQYCYYIILVKNCQLFSFLLISHSNPKIVRLPNIGRLSPTYYAPTTVIVGCGRAFNLSLTITRLIADSDLVGQVGLEPTVYLT